MQENALQTEYVKMATVNHLHKDLTCEAAFLAGFPAIVNTIPSL
ncbi:hypothetical protein DOY81_009606 [Sarcophaga bullata]|nr:hypothetical protein DOY81_009606 [Sarcophaga bullata]